MAKKNAAPPAPPASLVVYEVPVASLRPAEYNPRLMTEKEANDLRASLREFGFVEPLVINTFPGRENVVIGGHQRLRIAIEMGMASVPCTPQRLDEAHERELNLRLNKNLGSWDWDLLASFDPHELLAVGFDPREMSFHLDLDASAGGDEQSRLDKVSSMFITCPSCGHEFKPAS